MKKIFLTIVAAIMLMACNQQNTPSDPVHKAMTLVTSGAVDLIGQDSAVIEKQLIGVGFIKRPSEKALRAEYIYGIPTSAENLDEEGFYKAITTHINNGNIIINATVQYDEAGKMQYLYAVTYIGAEKPQETLIFLSNQLYSLIPAGAIGREEFPTAEWNGTFADSFEKEPEKVEDHAKLITLMKDAVEMVTEEEATVLNQAKADEEPQGFIYNASMAIPSEEQKAEALKKGEPAYSYASTIVADYSLLK